MALAFMFAAAYAKKDYAEVIEANWEIKLPAGCEVVYVKQSDPGINGENERYHVFNCASAEGMTELVQWYDGVVTDDASYRLLDVLGVKDEDYPQPDNYKKYVQTKEGGSTLVLLYALESKLLYVLEDFY